MFCLLLLNIYFLCLNFKINSLHFGTTFIVMLLGSIILEAILCLIIFLAKAKQWKIEKLFLALYLIIGSLYVFALPVGRAPDEESHFFRIYELSNGHLISDTNESGKAGSSEPSDIEIIRDYKEDNVVYSDVISDLDLYPDQSNQKFIQTSAYSYNLISYLPHVVGMSIGQLLHLPLLVTAYLAKFFNLATCAIILFFSIKYIPFFKKLLFFVAFLPIAIQATSSLSPDGLAMASSMALVSFVLYTIHSQKTILTNKQIVLAFFICLFVSMGKIAYTPLCLLLFAIPSKRFKTQKIKILTVLGIGVLVFISLFVWLLIAPSLQSAYDSSTQISAIITNPFEYLAILLTSIHANATMYLTGFLGGYLEWFDVTLSPIYLVASFVIFILLCVKVRETHTTTRSLKYMSIAIFSIITLLTFTTMFIQWTKPGAPTIDGVQGRYFLPLALIIPTMFLPISKSSPSKTPPASKHLPNYLYSFIIFESIYAILTIACTHL